MAVISLELFDVESEVAAPVIETVPVERPRDRVKTSDQTRARGVDRAAAQHGVVLGDELEPEEIVECEVEQRAVHVDEDGVDTIPIDGRGGCRRHVAMI